jgi:hypothetical protein
MKRVDALGQQHRDRYRVLTGRILDPELDDTLQRVVEEVARELAMPIALVSLVLERTQFFRAHVGLPEDLAVARSTDRDASFCQFVVRDGSRFEVTNALEDARVPKDLVDRYGIRAYVGQPISVAGAVVGSLCGIDVKPRTFSPEDRQRLADFALRVGARLEELAHERRERGRGLLERASAPAFAELRNVLTPLAAGVSSARVALADLAPLRRIAEALARQPGTPGAALAGLDRALLAFDDLAEILGDLEIVGQRLPPLTGALEMLLVGDPPATEASQVVDAASRLTLHLTRVTGGLAWDDVPRGLAVRTPRMVAVAGLSAAITMLADVQGPGPGGLSGRVRLEGGHVTFELRSPSVTAALAERCALELSRNLGDGAGAVISAAGDHLRVAMPSAEQRPPPAA